MMILKASWITLVFWNVLGLNPIEVINKKMDLNEKKYPVEKAKGVSIKYDKLKESDGR